MSSEEEVDSVEEEEEESDEEEEQEEEKPKRKRKEKNKKDPNKPKRNMSAFFLYSNANRQRVKNENPECKFGDIAKILSEEFKSLKPKEQAKWTKLAEKDKERYNKQMEGYTVPSDSDSDDGGKKKKGKKNNKKEKDPNAPKRNQSAFFLYSNATRADVKAAQPELAFGQIAQVISRNFKALSAEERSYWDRKAAQDKDRYQRELQAYQGH